MLLSNHCESHVAMQLSHAAKIAVSLVSVNGFVQISKQM